MPRRRSRGEGSIYQRKDGRWAASVSWGATATGKRRRKTVYGKTKKEVQNKLLALRTDVLHAPDRFGRESRERLQGYLEAWLAGLVQGRCRANTHRRYQGLVRNHIVPALGQVALRDLAPKHIHRLHSEMMERGLSPRSIEQAHAVLRKALNDAVMNQLLNRNPCSQVRPPRPQQREIHALSREQAQDLLATARLDPLNALYVLAITTGLRQGELLALRWGDVTLTPPSPALQVQRTLADVNGVLIFNEPKTRAGRRRVPLSEAAVAALREHEAAAVFKKPKNLVFTNKVGGPLRPSNFTRQRYKPLLERAGLPASTTFHMLRHTAATALLEEGVNPRVVQTMLGHASIQTTLSTYSHVSPGLQDLAAQRIDRWLQG